MVSLSRWSKSILQNPMPLHEQRNQPAKNRGGFLSLILSKQFLSADFLRKISKLILQFHIEMWGTLNSPENLENKEQSWRTHNNQFQSQPQSYSHRWYRLKDRHTDQWNRNGSAQNNPDIYGSIDSDKSAKTIQWGKTSLSNKLFWDNMVFWWPFSHAI